MWRKENNPSVDCGNSDDTEENAKSGFLKGVRKLKTILSKKKMHRRLCCCPAHAVTG